jgi:CRP-like cAMP-binding protein
MQGSANSRWIDLLAANLGGEPLGAAEREALARTQIGTRSYRRFEFIMDHDDDRAPLHLVTRGWAARVHLLHDGSQQITDFVLPGELCDLSRLTDGLNEKAIALTPLKTTLLRRSAVLRVIEAYPRLGVALLRLALREQAILREWLVCLGRRDKREHLAHLLCELHQRLRRAGLVADHHFDLPLTQEQLADATGMTAVHTNRVLRGLRKDGIISLGHQHLTIHKPAQLEAIAEFDASYLEG